MHENHDLTEVRYERESIIFCLDCMKEVSAYKGASLVEDDDEGKGAE